MTEDASLDQFASSGEADESESDDSVDSEPVEPESTDSETSEGTDEQSEDVEKTSEGLAEDATVEPAVSTYEWSPEGGECADCGASAGRRWRAGGQKDGDLVCADCKEW